MNKIKHHLLLFFLFSWMISESQQDSLLRLSFNYISDQDGLPPSQQYHISQDGSGMIWIGSDNGLFRFDGKRLREFRTRQSDSINHQTLRVTSQVFEDRTGSLWYSSPSFLHEINPEDKTQKTYSISTSYRNYHIIQILKDQIWFQVEAEDSEVLYTVDITTKEFSRENLIEGKAKLSHFDIKGKPRYVISTSLKDVPGLVVLDRVLKKRQHIEFKEASNGRKLDHSSPTKSLVLDVDTIWVGLYNSIGRYVLGDSEGIAQIQRGTDIPRDIGWVHDLAKLDRETILVSADQGLLTYNLRTNRFIQIFNEINSSLFDIKVKNPNRVSIDRSNNIWVSNGKQNIAFANKAKIKFDLIRELAGKEISAIFEDLSGRVWCSTSEDGVYIFDKNEELISHTTKLIVPGPGYNSTLPEIKYFIKDKEGGIWGNNGNSFLRWDSLKNSFEYKDSYFLNIGKSVSNEISLCHQLLDGTNLAVVDNEVFQLQLKPDKVSLVKWKDLSRHILNDIVSLYQPKEGCYYFGTDRNEIFIYDSLGVIRLQRNSRSMDFYLEPKIDTLWIATNGGLKITSFQNILEHGSYYNPNTPIQQGIQKIIPEGSNLWLLANDGLIKYNRKQKTSHHFSQADGLLANSFNSSATIQNTSTGKIWLGSKEGLNIFDPAQITLSQFQPEIELINILVNDEIHEIEENKIEIDKYIFSYDQNTLSFQFVALDYSDPQSNNYYYQMDGIDENRVDNGSSGFARYANLRPGNYTFKMWASNSDQILNKEPRKIRLYIRPPFYQTWWFTVLTILFVSSIIYAIFKYRLEQALKVERLRVKISSDLHDDVGGLLSGLAMQSEILELTAQEETKPKLRRIAELSRTAMSRMRDTVWAIDARKDKMEDVKDRMIEHAEETLIPKNFQYEIQFNNVDLKSQLSTEFRQNFYLIYKEAITNIAKHSIGKKVETTLSLEGKMLKMRIWDDGLNKLKRKKSTGAGMSNMRMRAEKLGGVLTTADNSGFEVTLSVPF